MWKSLLFLCLFVVGGALGAATREKIAVASDNRAKLSENEIQALTSRIEAKLNGKFNVVTRSALEAILRENQFQTESGLVDDRGTLARFGKVSGVNLLLHYTVAKLGNKYTMSFMLVNCTTGERRGCRPQACNPACESCRQKHFPGGCRCFREQAGQFASGKRRF